MLYQNKSSLANFDLNSHIKISVNKKSKIQSESNVKITL